MKHSEKYWLWHPLRNSLELTAISCMVTNEAGLLLYSLSVVPFSEGASSAQALLGLGEQWHGAVPAAHPAPIHAVLRP